MYSDLATRLYIHYVYLAVSSSQSQCIVQTQDIWLVVWVPSDDRAAAEEGAAVDDRDTADTDADDLLSGDAGAHDSDGHKYEIQNTSLNDSVYPFLSALYDPLQKYHYNPRRRLFIKSCPELVYMSDTQHL